MRLRTQGVSRSGPSGVSLRLRPRVVEQTQAGAQFSGRARFQLSLGPPSVQRQLLFALGWDWCCGWNRAALENLKRAAHFNTSEVLR